MIMHKRLFRQLQSYSGADTQFICPNLMKHNWQLGAQAMSLQFLWKNICEITIAN